MAELLELFAERAGDYRAGLHRCAPDQIGATVARLLADATGVVLPPGLPNAWTAALARPLLPDAAPSPPLPHAGDVATGAEDPHCAPAVPRLLTPADLDAPGLAVLTGCVLAIAETGTLVLDAGPKQGRRLLTLVPDHHVCIVHADQVVADVPDMIAALPDPTRPITMISGPSATSDIELNRVEGVHGPRRLDIILVC
jgi:L-lactate dehydrogenase complex protein LldG